MKTTRKNKPATKKAKNVKSPRRSAVPSAARTAAETPAPATAEPEATVHKDTKKAAVLALLRRPQGASNQEIRDETGWLPHTVRGFLSTVPKKLGHACSATKNDSGVTIYRIEQ